MNTGILLLPHRIGARTHRCGNPPAPLRSTDVCQHEPGPVPGIQREAGIEPTLSRPASLPIRPASGAVAPSVWQIAGQRDSPHGHSGAQTALSGQSWAALRSRPDMNPALKHAAAGSLEPAHSYLPPDRDLGLRSRPCTGGNSRPDRRHLRTVPASLGQSPCPLGLPLSRLPHSGGTGRTRMTRLVSGRRHCNACNRPDRATGPRCVGQLPLRTPRESRLRHRGCRP